jgi:RNA polymerase sigma-70 factor (sigma-E family)
MADTAPGDFVAWVGGARGPLTRSAYLVTGSEALADDLVQEAMIKVARRWSRLRTGNPTAYARTIIHRDHVTWWRRRRRESPVADPIERVSPHDADLVERRILVHDALGGLTRRQRAVLVLRYFDDLTERETAAVLGVSVGTVKSQTSVALHRLRQQSGLDVLRGGDA